jgi:2-isopropylmalate synthase
MDRVAIFDTTLRDGEQAPGFSMTPAEKLRFAQQLEQLGVDVIEAGFPIASEGDFLAVQRIAKEVRNTTIAGLARAVDGDIMRCWEAIEQARRPRIHTFLATSDIHLERKLCKSREAAREQAVRAVELARRYCDDVEFSAEDAARSDVPFLCSVLEAVIDAGATVVNVPDTVGYAMPDEYGWLIRTIRERVPSIERAIVSTHCHDDLGLAVANSLAGVQNGARQVECAVNGIGERAGNASLEEVVMAMAVRKRFMQVRTAVNTEEIYRTSKLLTELTGANVQANKAIVGRNAFAHEAGIHQDGMLKAAVTYEIMSPLSVGAPESRLVLGKHSGRHALDARLRNLGYNLQRDELERAYREFLQIADRQKVVEDGDLRALFEHAHAV